MTSVSTPPVGASPAAGPSIAAHPGRSSVAERLEHVQVTDYDVHGIVGVRLVDAAPVDTRAVERHLRGFRRPLQREPDLVVRFVDRLPTAGLRCVDVDRSGFDDECFMVRTGAARAGWVRIPFDQLGAPCELVSERGLGLVPHFKPLLRLVALQRGYVPMHASAFQWGGAGVLVTGWTHGGKTSALLAFAGHGARFVGDDLVLITGDGRGMFGLSTPLNVSVAQLRQSPRLRGQVRRRQVAVLGVLDRLDHAEERCTARWPRGGYPLTMLRKAMRPVRRRFGVRMPPEHAFPAGVIPTAAPRTLFLMMSHRRPDVSVEPVDPMEVVERMVHSLRFEDLELLGEYSAFRFAFPRRQHANELIERAHEIAHARLRHAFAGLEAHVVRHPYPPPLGRLFDVMSPLCATVPDARSGG